MNKRLSLEETRAANELAIAAQAPPGHPLAEPKKKPYVPDPERKLTKEMAAANALREALKTIVGDDDETMRDTIEGETNLHEAIASVMATIFVDETHVLGIKVMVEKLKERQQRLEERIERRRTIIEQAMVMGELPKLELPDATISLRKVPPAVEITDESAIPAAYWKPADPKLDKKALAEALKGGAAIPGAVLGNGGVGLTIRRA